MICVMRVPGAKLDPPTTMPTWRPVVSVPVTLREPAVVVAFFA